MGSSRSQRKKERHAQRRKERKKRQQAAARQQGPNPQPAVAIASNARHRQRLLEQRPLAWDGEPREDAAIFDDAALSSLPPDLASQATAVREALRDALESRGDVALKGLSSISRGSPFSEWRLFLRGLIPWLADDKDAAGETWKRLAPERRPGRIATAMMLSLRTDLEGATPGQRQSVLANPGEESRAPAWESFDGQQLYHAKLLRRVRFDRLALKVAEAGLAVRDETADLLVGPSKIRWLHQFIEEYGDTEPELAVALAQCALGRASRQNFVDVFEQAVRTFKGPRHDRRNRLLSFFYYMRFERDATAKARVDRELDEYLNRDLPQNEEISAPLRGAIASQIHIAEATAQMGPPRIGGMFADLFGSAPDNTPSIRKHLQAAMKAYPSNGAAYKAYVDWIESKLQDDRLTKAKRAPLEKELADVMRRWSKGLPDQVEPRLWLVDHLLEEEQLEEARPHVEFLAASRQDDPRVRATPWKWQILEAMRLCRRKAWLADVPARLDEAEALWPSWLPRHWLPYLRAAWLLRCGKTEQFEDARRQIGEGSGRARDSLADACMMLGAAQQLRVPAADLKPLRDAVDRAVKGLKGLPIEDLLEAGGFFWDMIRVRLLYPAYRMHGATIGKELVSRLEGSTRMVLQRVNDERVQSAVLWASEFRFWPSSYDKALPPFFDAPSVKGHPIYMAAKLNSFLRQTYHWSLEKYLSLGPALRTAAASQRDAYYRRWFVLLADELDELNAESRSRFFNFPLGGAWGTTSDDDDDDDDDLDFDPDCDCPSCQAARKAHEQATSSGPKRP